MVIVYNDWDDRLSRHGEIMTKDVITAFKSMGAMMMHFIKELALLVYRVSIALAIFGATIFLIINYVWYFLGAIVIAAFSGWFFIEYKEAKNLREYEELKNEKV